jgi:hypothetical protein
LVTRSFTGITQGSPGTNTRPIGGSCQNFETTSLADIKASLRIIQSMFGFTLAFVVALA